MSHMLTVGGDRGRRIVWEDDFDGATLGDGWNITTRVVNPNGEEQAYTDRSTNVRVADSTLILECHRESYMGQAWTSGRVDTNDLHEFHFGRMEARMKLPHGWGFWPAFWMLGANSGVALDESGVATVIGQPWPECGEIDIMESYNFSTNYTSGAIWGGGSENSWHGPIARTDWNVYALEWTPETLEFYVNDTLNWTWPTSTISAMQKPMYLILNFAVGGNTPTDETTPDTAQALVDWVRVYAPAGDRVVRVPETLTLDKATATATVGGAQVIVTATIAPSTARDKGIAWTSSDEAVAIVGGGYVTAVGAGTATITATTWNGLTATCAVTVTAP